MIKMRVIGVMFVCGFLGACGASNDTQEEAFLSGTWKHVCKVDRSLEAKNKTTIETAVYYPDTTTYTDSEVTIKYVSYESNNCIDEVDDFYMTGTYIIGDSKFLDDGLEVKNIDLVISHTEMDITFEIAQIILIEQGYLYEGVENADGSRPTEIYFDSWSEKQL
ncbi:hypothetical protein CW745_16085 [Psychromonas sp. psych-6C06]|uniref:hypothetical protein n=1 Tax=Psychromonas sp. psych-6C06 TaxID=2058089 RepID=UPI000C347E95|nr:hypothetical protein [Psychromonas sp. psych-6C06]PKF60236.1 hypothetical protein CW745_16085 [Psychromonas sp. psych-6C06]